MNHQDIDSRSPMMHRIAGAVLRPRRMILVSAFFVIIITGAYLVPMLAMVLKILLTLLLVLLLNLITFRGAILQDLVQKLTHYFAPQDHKTADTFSSSTQTRPPDP